jgi:hypothetical protein
MDWQPIVTIEHYLVKPQAILDVAETQDASSEPGEAR